MRIKGTCVLNSCLLPWDESERKVEWGGTLIVGGWQMIGAVREKERGSEEMLGMPSVLCCPVTSLAVAILRRSPPEVASSRSLSGHA
jgi:hypothetical protein